MDIQELQPGRKYKLTYKVPGIHRVPREMVATFLAFDQEGGYRGAQILIFSGRPQFGTTQLKAMYFRTGVVEMPFDAECYTERKVKA